MNPVGIGLRAPWSAALASQPSDRLDFLEIIPENHLGRGGRELAELRACRERWPVYVHGVTASVGGPDAYDPSWLEALSGLLREVDAPFYSDHLCFTSWGGFQSHELLPVPTTEGFVRHAAARIRELRDRLDRPVAVENISYYARMPGSDLDEPDFVAAVVAEADCLLLLDVNNVYVNARNFGRDPLADLARFPLERVAQVHVAGHEQRGGRWIDHHGAPVCDEVLSLARWVSERRPDVPILLERDLNLPPLHEVLDEVDRLRAALVGREAA